MWKILIWLKTYQFVYSTDITTHDKIRSFWEAFYLYSQLVGKRIALEKRVFDYTIFDDLTIYINNNSHHVWMIYKKKSRIELE